jgi:hypothetical protein
MQSSRQLVHARIQKHSHYIAYRQIGGRCRKLEQSHGPATCLCTLGERDKAFVTPARCVPGKIIKKAESLTSQ